MSAELVMLWKGKAKDVFRRIYECKGIHGSFYRAQIEVRCAWCGKLMGYKDGQGQTGVSHGICGGCLVQAEKEVPK